MGKVVFWTLIRIAILIPTVWIFLDFIEYRYWWAVLSISIYGVVIHPAVIQYKLFKEENKEILKGTLCSACKHFDESAVLCLKHDKHPTIHEIPCEGLDWEPSEFSYSADEV